MKENRSDKRRVVVALRERRGRVLPFVARSEGEGVTLVNENVDRMATISADEASHWDLLHAGWDVERVNHSEIYSDHGKHTNMVESYFSRLRRMVMGQHHHVSPQYLHRISPFSRSGMSVSREECPPFRVGRACQRQRRSKSQPEPTQCSDSMPQHQGPTGPSVHIWTLDRAYHERTAY